MEKEIRINRIEPANKMFVLAAVLVVSIVGFLILKTIYNFKTLPQNYPQDISVFGEGKAYAKPDVATVNLGMSAQGLKSQDVVDKNNQIMNQVIRSIKDLGVEERDIQTTLYNLNPIYDYTERGRVFKGYSLDQQISVKIRDFDKISDILDKATASGANTVGDLQFIIDNPESVKAEARAKAIEQAKQKALTLVGQAGLRIEKLINISEGYASTPPPIYGQGFAGAAIKEFVAPQIQVGQTEITTTVNLTYRVR